MSAVWQTRLAGSVSRMTQAATTSFFFLSRPEQFRKLQLGIVLVLALWCLWSLWRAVWSFVPVSEPLPALDVLNPITSNRGGSKAADVDITALVEAHLFGEPGEALVENVAGAEAEPEDSLPPDSPTAGSLAGIEDGAPETRLPLVLRGVVSSTEEGLGQAVIEHRKTQDLYLVGDDLPVNGRVVLAKVMSTQVVLDNGGRYEVLKLFDDAKLAKSAAVAAAPAKARRPATDRERAPVEAAQSRGEEVADLAAQYRDRLYRNPESLADVVRVTAVRQDGELRGYRISPGKSGEAFDSLGFKAGDLVTSVNGMALSDPSNTVRLYQAMRSASEAVFEMEREGQPVTLSVSIADAPGGGRR